MAPDRALRPLVQLAGRGCYSRSSVSFGTSRSQWFVCKGLASPESLAVNRQSRPVVKSTTFLLPKPFSTCKCLLKKGGKASRAESQPAPNSQSVIDPFDLETLESEIAALIERLKSDLSKLRAGGRFNMESLENLRVQPDKKSTQTVKLTDVATVVPKGRTAQVIVGDKDHVKPVTTAIQSSTLSLTPQPDPTGTNLLLLIINIPPPTTERREAVVKEAKTAGEKAGTSLREARAKQHKKMRAMEKMKDVRPDDLRKAMGMMEKTVEKGQGEIKKIVDAAKRVLEAG